MTLDPDKLGICKPLVCRFCNILLKTLCSDAVEEADVAPPAAAVEAVDAVPPPTPCIRLLNELSRLEMAGVVAPVEPTC